MTAGHLCAIAALAFGPSGNDFNPYLARRPKR
jgi:hypothetical protein